MEADYEKFKVREKLRGLQSKGGYRFLMLFFTDIKVYLIETDATSGLRNANIAAPIFFLFNKIHPEKHFDRFEEMDDTREIINATTWFRTWPYENIVSMWIEEGEDDLSMLWFDVIQPENRRKYYGDEDGVDNLWFRKEFTEEYVRVLSKMLGYKFHGIKSVDQKVD